MSFWNSLTRSNVWFWRINQGLLEMKYSQKLTASFWLTQTNERPRPLNSAVSLKIDCRFKPNFIDNLGLECMFSTFYQLCSNSSALEWRISLDTPAKNVSETNWLLVISGLATQQSLDVLFNVISVTIKSSLHHSVPSKCFHYIPESQDILSVLKIQLHEL